MSGGGVFAGRYRVEREVGEGGAARVILATDTELDRPVAIKVMTAESAIASPQRFVEEADAMAALEHPHILKIYDVALSGNRPYLVLEYAPGGSLHELAAGEGLPLERVLEIAEGLLDALLYSHSRGVIHRDVKPENVLLAADGTPKLADFGLAKGKGSGVRTATGVILGTPQYLAPELLLGETYTPASDLYAWGATVQFLVTGRPGFDGPVSELLKHVGQGRSPIIPSAGPLEEAIRLAVAGNPRDRADGPTLAKALARARAATGETLHLELDAQDEGAPRGSARAPALRDSELGSAVGSGLAAAAPRGPPRPLGPRVLGAGLAALACLGVLVAWPGGGPAESAPVVATRDPTADAARLLATWEENARKLGIRDRVIALHSRVYLDENPRNVEHFAAIMEKVRQGRPYPREHVDLEPLGPAARELPFREEFEGARAELRRTLGDGRVPYGMRRDLAAALQRFASLDAYFEAWGKAAPYGAMDLVRVLFPVRAALLGGIAEVGDLRATAQWDPSPPDRPRVGPGEEPGPGTHLIYHWTDDPRREWPAMLHHVDPLSSSQDAAWQTFYMLKGKFGSRPDMEPYSRAKVRVTLGPEPTRRYEGATLRFTLSNQLRPDALRIRWNDTILDWRPPAEFDGRGGYDMPPIPEYTLEVPLPPGSWRGENELVVRLVELEGLVHVQSLDLWEIELVLEAAGAGGTAD